MYYNWIWHSLVPRLYGWAWEWGKIWWFLSLKMSRISLIYKTLAGALIHTCTTFTFPPPAPPREKLPYETLYYMPLCITKESNGRKTCIWGSLVPRPRPAFRRLQYGKAGRAWYLFSREHDVIGKWRNFQKKQAAFCVLFSRLHAQRSVYTTIALC